MTKVDLPRQNNYLVALEKAWERLARRPAADLARLGAAEVHGGSGRVLLRVLDRDFEIDLPRREVALAGPAHAGEAGPVPLTWQILSLHYLAAPVPIARAGRLISFEGIPQGRGYSAAYRGRVIGRFCRTAGRDRETLDAAARALGARIMPGGDLSLRLAVFPFVPVTVVWYAGDDELPPGASFLYEDNVTSIFEVEDIVVTAERVVSRLSGKPW